GGSGIPSPAAAPGVRRDSVDVSHRDVRLDFIFVQPRSRRGMIDRVEQAKKFAGAITVTKQRESNHRPQCRMCVLPSILAHAGNVTFDVTWIQFTFVEGRSE